jgi:hypothetical protein
MRLGNEARPMMARSAIRANAASSHTSTAMEPLKGTGFLVFYEGTDLNLALLWTHRDQVDFYQSTTDTSGQDHLHRGACGFVRLVLGVEESRISGANWAKPSRPSRLPEQHGFSLISSVSIGLSDHGSPTTAAA